MTAIPSESCNNQVVLMGIITGVNVAYGNTSAYGYLTVGSDEFQIDFELSLYVPQCLEGRNIRIVGEISSNYHGDVVIKVHDYRMTTKFGIYLKNKPNEWEGEWPNPRRGK